MSYIVLARKWRPMSFDDLVGQDHVARTLANAIASGRVAHAFLFTGVRGVGKTTSARILAKALNCMGDPDMPREGDPGPTASPCLKCPACLQIAEGNDMDVREIDGASYNGVEEVRKLQDSLPYRPNRDRYKIFIVDEVHMLSQSAWNAFLKTLEEPPPHVKFIFATTEVHKVPVTILSRVQRFDFKLISTEQLSARLRYVLEQENIAFDESAVSIVAREAAGSMRDAMSLLDQVIAYNSKQLIGDDVARVLGVASHRVLYELAEAILNSKAEQALKMLAELAEQGFDMSIVARDLLAVLRDIVVAKVCNTPGDLLQLAEEEREHILKIASTHPTDDVLRMHQAFSHQFDDVVRSSEPRQALEMLLVRLSRRPPLVPVDDLIDRLKHLERRLAGASPTSGTPAGNSPGSRPPSSNARVATSTGRSAGAAPPAGTPPTSPSPASSTAASEPRRLAPSQIAPAKPVPPNPSLAETQRPVAGNSTPVQLQSRAPATMLASQAHGAALAPRVNGNAALDTSLPARSVEARTELVAPVASPEPTPDAEPLAGASSPAQPPSLEPEPALDTAAATTASAALTPEAGPPAPTAIDEKSELFRKLVTRVQSDHPHLAAMLCHAIPVAMNRQQITLGFEKDSVFVKMARAPEAFAALEVAARAELGPSTKVVITDTPASSAGEQTLATIQQKEREQQHRLAIERARQHPAVQKAIAVLGARVKSIKLPESPE